MPHYGCAQPAQPRPGQGPSLPPLLRAGSEKERERRTAIQGSQTPPQASQAKTTAPYRSISINDGFIIRMEVR